MPRGEFGFGQGTGHGGHGGHGPGRGRRGPAQRTRRGDIRIALLMALGDGPAHGYELIQRLEERTSGRWRPSPGSVYPTLQMLEEQGFVRSEQRDDKRVFEITEAGQAELVERTADAGGPPWMLVGENATAHSALRHSAGQLMMAAKQVGMAGDAALIEQATAIVNEARRKLYQLLAEA
jgi:DNA-binding PadR family transcriptional regulator